ncbi:MAG: glycosyltransferase family 2 protein, partial [Burkholderiales bacterium]
MTLSVAIIARNEARVIGRCLESVAWADEIIVLD